MAKAKTKKKAGGSSPASSEAPDPLRPGLDAFARGAYPEARALLGARAEASDASESERKMAERFIAATKLERGTLLAGLACFGLYALVIVVTLFKQP